MVSCGGLLTRLSLRLRGSTGQAIVLRGLPARSIADDKQRSSAPRRVSTPAWPVNSWTLHKRKQKKFQEIHLPQRRLTAGMHGLSLVNRVSRTSSVSLPVLCLPAKHGLTLHSPSASPSQSGPISPSGLSLARNENPLSELPPRGHGSWPTTSISIGPSPESVPVRCSRAPRRRPLPFRGFYAPPDQSVPPVRLSGSPSSQFARFPFAPRGQTP
jgi:hypothetical protein